METNKIILGNAIEERRKKYQKEYQLINIDKIKKQQHEKYLKSRDKILTKNKTIPIKYNIYKSRAKRNNLYFNLDLKTFTKLMQGICVYCGSNSSSVDRIDSSKGYLKDNCVPCCIVCNRMKNKFTAQEFFIKCLRVVLYNNLL